MTQEFAGTAVDLPLEGEFFELGMSLDVVVVIEETLEQRFASQGKTEHASPGVTLNFVREHFVKMV